VLVRVAAARQDVSARVFTVLCATEKVQDLVYDAILPERRRAYGSSPKHQARVAD
jgi:hypothetical protein